MAFDQVLGLKKGQKPVASKLNENRGMRKPVDELEKSPLPGKERKERKEYD